jgi:HK97 family phage prohead protease
MKKRSLGVRRTAVDPESMKARTLSGITCAIEHAAGSVVPIQTTQGEVFRNFSVDYGFVRALDNKPMTIMGHDGDMLDAYVGLHPKMKRVTIVSQLFHEGEKAGQPDEAKAMFGFRTKTEAVTCYQQHTAPGMYGGCATMSVTAFRDHIKAHAESGTKDPIVFPVDAKNVGGMPWFSASAKEDPENAEEVDDDVKAALALATKAIAEAKPGERERHAPHPAFAIPKSAFFRLRKAGVWRGWMEDDGWTWLALLAKDGTIALFSERDPATGAVKGAPILCARANDDATTDDLEEDDEDEAVSPKKAPAAPTQAHAATDPGQGGMLARTPAPSAPPRETSHAYREALRHLAAAALILPLSSAPELADSRDVLRAFALGAPAGAAAVPGGQAPAPGVPGPAAGAVPDAARPEGRSLADPRTLALHVRQGKGSIREKDRIAVFIASTDAVDSYGEVVDQEGWDFSRFEKNPVILFAHDSRSLPIGKAVNWYVEPTADGRKQLVIEVFFSRVNPFAEMAWQMVLEETLRACSVGFMPGGIETRTIDGKERIVLVRNCLFELSVCPVPANHEAVLRLEENVLGKVSASLHQRMGAMLADLEPQVQKAIGGIQDELGRVKAALEALLQRASSGTVTAVLARTDHVHSGPPAPAAPTPTAPVARGSLDDEGFKTAIPFKHYPLSSAEGWDAGAARARLRKFCSSDGSGDLDKINTSQYGACFAIRVGDPKLLESYKLPHTDVVNGKLTTVWGGVKAAGNVLMGGQGGIKLSPADMAAAKSHLGKHYKEFTKVPPWEQEDAAALFSLLTASSTPDANKDKTTMRFTHRVTDPSLLTKLREHGSVVVLVPNADGTDQHELTLELPAVQKHIDAMDTKNAGLTADLQTMTASRDKANTDLAKKTEEYTGVLAELTKLELEPITGLEDYQITPHEATTYAALRGSSPEQYKGLVAAARERYKQGHDKAMAEARQKAAAGQGEGGHGGTQRTDTTALPAGAPAERTPPTREADTTPRTGSPGDPAMGDAWETLSAEVERGRGR